MIDFRELSVGIAGERLEAVARIIAIGMGLVPTWSGRGPDQGRDLFFTETLKGQLHEESRKWLVSCKDNSRSGKSVSEAECGEVLDKVKQHKCDGFLLVTTTTAGAALKAKLDSLDVASGGQILTQVWDMYQLDLLLRRPENSDVFRSYFQESWKAESNLPIEEALLIIESKLTSDQFEILKGDLGLQAMSKDLPSGYDISPDHNKTASLIDKLNTLLSKGEFNEATRVAGHLEADVFTKLLNLLEVRAPDVASLFLREFIRHSDQSDLVLNAFQLLVDNEEISPKESIELSSHLDEFELETIYGDAIAPFVQNEILSNSSEYEFWGDVDQLSSRTSIGWALIDTLRFPTRTEKQINFDGTFALEVQLVFEGGKMGNPMSFPGKFVGHMDQTGMYLTSATIDTSSFHK